MPFVSDASATPLRDQLSIYTPELVAIEFPPAGVGSRFVALLLDYLLQAATVVLVSLIIALIVYSSHTSPAPATPPPGGAAEKWAMAIVIAIPFLLEWTYFALFEAFWRGQTPGKRIMKIRVIQQTGRPVTLIESLGRNLVRVIDMLPGFYVVGLISMFVTKRQQRLGDLVAGTLVVHEQGTETPLEAIGGSRSLTAGIFKPIPAAQPTLRMSRIPADTLSALTLEDLQALESYLARRLDVPLETREKLAGRLTGMITSKTQAPVPEGISQETFLEEVASALRSIGVRPKN
jgi:uncharacterized RDD family membrane protein YckC